MVVDAVPVIAKSVVVAPTVVRLVKRPLVAKSVVEVALVVVALTAKRFDTRALVEKKLVEVALVEVLLVKVAFVPKRVRSVVSPVFDIEKRVEVAPVLEVEPIAKSKLLAMLVVDAACIERSAEGEEEPTESCALKKPLPETFSSWSGLEECVGCTGDGKVCRGSVGGSGVHCKEVCYQSVGREEVG